MKPGHVLDPETGLPKVQAIRTTDGQLIFAYETRRAGGMCVLVDVPQEALTGRRQNETSDAADLNAQLAEAARITNARILGGEADEEIQPDLSRHAVRVSDSTSDELAARLSEAEEKEAAARELEAKAEARVEAAEDEVSQKDVEIAELRRQLAEKQSGSGSKPRSSPKKSTPRRSRAKAAA